MKAASDKIAELISAKYEDFDQMFHAIQQFASSSAADREQLAAYIDRQDSPHPDEALKLAVAALVLGRFEQAVPFLRAVPESREKRWMLGLAFKGLRDYSHALEDFNRALTRGFDRERVLAEMVETHRLAGDLKSAKQTLRRFGRAGPNSAYYHYQAAGIAEAEGDNLEAIHLLEKAVALAPEFVPAAFRLAFLVDLRGDDQRAIELYSRCVKHDPAHVNAFINLAVIYEDLGEYEKAIELLRHVLYVYPNHQRARLFLKDAQSSRTMFYDEEYEKRRDKHRQVLDMPISDFELSVRSRNCLKKMGIRTLGDLTRITEAELLAYKNFGETSLTEIKGILTSKGLKLGQALDDQASKRAAAGLSDGEADAEPTPADTSLLAKSIDELKLSVRSKKCLQKLNIQTIGDLVKYTEAQLMAIKNFGTISLAEVKEKLTAANLSLRKPEI